MRYILRAFLVLVFVGLIGAGTLLWQLRKLHAFATTPVAAPDEVVVRIPARLGPHGVTERFAKAGVVSSARLFYWDIRFIRRAAGRLKAGEYLFKAGVAETPDEIIDRLLKGEVLNVKVTIPEGLRIDEQAPIFEANGIGNAADYVRLAHDKAFVKSLGITGYSLEGYLFPDTYLVPRNITTRELLKVMVEHFRQAWETAQAQRAPGEKLNEHDAVTLASIIEKETAVPDERPRISCVFHNRLKKGMMLQTDPTVIYAKILRTGSYDGHIYQSDLDAPNPYNTYANYGLPPGPIASAGLAALDAALNPLACNDLYFVSHNDGTHVFCPDLACHEANVRKYWAKKREAEREVSREATHPASNP